MKETNIAINRKCLSSIQFWIQRTCQSATRTSTQAQMSTLFCGEIEVTSPGGEFSEIQVRQKRSDFVLLLPRNLLARHILRCSEAGDGRHLGGSGWQHAVSIQRRRCTAAVTRHVQLLIVSYSAPAKMWIFSFVHQKHVSSRWQWLLPFLLCRHENIFFWSNLPHDKAEYSCHEAATQLLSEFMPLAISRNSARFLHRNLSTISYFRTDQHRFPWFEMCLFLKQSTKQMTQRNYFQFSCWKMTLRRTFRKEPSCCIQRSIVYVEFLPPRLHTNFWLETKLPSVRQQQEVVCFLS